MRAMVIRGTPDSMPASMEPPFLIVILQYKVGSFGTDGGLTGNFDGLGGATAGSVGWAVGAGASVLGAGGAGMDVGAAGAALPSDGEIGLTSGRVVEADARLAVVVKLGTTARVRVSTGIGTRAL